MNTILPKLTSGRQALLTRKFILISFCGLIAATPAFAQKLQVNKLVCENRINPVGIGIGKPQLGWQLSSNKRNVMQSAYEIRVASTAELLTKKSGIVWGSNKVSSGQSVHVPYSGGALKSGQKYYWQVKVWDNLGNESDWSTPASWQMGLLQTSDWKAKWIEPGYKEDSLKRPSPLLRKQFNAAKKVQSATAFITAHGMYEASLNGKRVGKDYFTPGWTSYNKRLQYQVYDVTDYLISGKNAVGVVLGSGWYRGNLAFSGDRNFYGKGLALLFQLEIIYTDGTTETVISDESWKSATGSIVSSELYHGEEIDARLEKTGWMLPQYNDSQWEGVTTKVFDNSILTSTINEPVRKQEVIKAVKVFKTRAGEQVIDFGQNLVGFVQVNVQGKAGDKIILNHAEVLDKAGNFYTENLRAAKQQNTYILKGGKTEVFEPHFAFQGFRYVKVTGFPGEIKPENFTAIVLHSAMQPTGKFSSSSQLLNQLQHNIQWGQKGNFLDVPTDCPQRDERLGWTGDAQVFSRTAAYNMQVNNFFAKWMKDVAADQREDGSVPFVIPNVLGADAAGSTGWADAATIIPWDMYQVYGDKRILEEQYPSMEAWVGFMEKKSKNNLWNTGFHFGDWLFYRPDDDNDGRSAVTDKYLIAQCFFANSVQIMINTANVLGKTDDVQKYRSLLDKIKAAFLKEYVTPNGRLVSSTQTAYVLALNFDMLPENKRAGAAERLVENIKDYNNHLTTGFLGTPYLCHVLTRFGYYDMAYTLLMQENYPSWLYPVKMGATTIWERWDGQKPDGTFQTPGMNSFNHYAYGAIGDWMYRSITGIDTDNEAVGYKKITIRPHTSGNIVPEKNANSTDNAPQYLSNASAELQTNYGKVSSGWTTGNGKLKLDIEIPANTTATIYIPAKTAASVSEADKALSASKDIKIKGQDGKHVVVEAGSGKYSFVVN